MSIGLLFPILLAILILPKKQEQLKEEEELEDEWEWAKTTQPIELENPEAAALNTQKILEAVRDKNQAVIHVQHNAKNKATIHKFVSPISGEKVITKDYANSFKDTDLLTYLRENNIRRLVICGMMTHMCVEAATRAAKDFGFICVVIADACTTRDPKYKNKIVKATDVHNSTLSTLASGYAKIIDSQSFLKKFH